MKQKHAELNKRRSFLEISISTMHPLLTNFPVSNLPDRLKDMVHRLGVHKRMGVAVWCNKASHKLGIPQ